MKKTINIDIYKTKLIVLINEPYTRLIKHYNKYNQSIDDEIKDWLGLTTYIPNDEHHLIWVAPHDNVIQLLSVISHEVLHMTQQLLEYLAMPLTDQSSEAYAYLYQYVFTEIIKAYLPKYLK